MRELSARTLLLFAVPVVLLALATAHATDVKGSVRVADGYVPEPAADARKPYYWEEWNGFLDPRPRRLDPRRDLAVALFGPPPADADHHITIQFQGGGLLPSTIVVGVGTLLRIDNHDDFGHELYAEGLDGFSAEGTSSGQSRSVNLTQAGHYVLRDRQAPHLHGDLHVVAGIAAVLQPAADGSFTFAGVAPGQYTLKVYAGAREATTQAVNVTDSHEPLVVEPIVLTPAAPAAAH